MESPTDPFIHQKQKKTSILSLGFGPFGCYKMKDKEGRAKKVKDGKIKGQIWVTMTCPCCDGVHNDVSYNKSLV